MVSKEIEFPKDPSEYPKQFQHYIDEAYNLLKNTANLTKENGWIFSEEGNGVKIHQKKSESDNLVMVRGEGLVPGTPDEVANQIGDQKKAFEMDPMLVELKTLWKMAEGSSGSSMYVDYARQGKMWMVTDRDFVLLKSKIKEENGSYFLTGNSVDWKDCPPVKGAVRAHCHFGGYRIEPVENEPKKSKVIYILKNDLKGWLPTMIVNKVIKGQGYNVLNVRKGMEKIVK